MTAGALFELLHFVEFAILYVLIIGALAANHRLSVVTSYIAAGAAMLYGVGDEIHQFYVPGRSFTVIDLVKNGTGILAALGVVHFLYFNKVSVKYK
ncbi:VanZ family protein [Halobacillus sp. A1]|uniref:VanZ family protein n=1 Tax=Halobacillus sp. A1 TaxID=2880262 RepID=UPI0020A6B25F|nr:VanZ family protein [Halobacillus sp. A1]MCP3031615.1 VanZ family protein [Halobacillus sp. A1]